MSQAKVSEINLTTNFGYKVTPDLELVFGAGYRIADATEPHPKKTIINVPINSPINSFKLSMFQFDKILFNNTYNKLLHKKTFREIFKDVFIPFLDHIGLLWQTDTLLPAHEHFISNLIAQKIQINTEKLQYSISNSNKTYVLFLPENEIHELGLLYLNYELVLRGNHTIYLGQSLPLNNLDYFFKNGRDICFITSMTVMPYDSKTEDYFKEIDSILKNTNHQLIAIGIHRTRFFLAVGQFHVIFLRSTNHFDKRLLQDSSLLNLVVFQL